MRGTFNTLIKAALEASMDIFHSWRRVFDPVELGSDLACHGAR